MVFLRIVFVMVMSLSLVTCSSNLKRPPLKQSTVWKGHHSKVDIITLGQDIFDGYVDREYHCFLRAVYWESFDEGILGQQSVAQVLFNRLMSDTFPNDMCKITSQRLGSHYQFQWMNNSKKRNYKLSYQQIEYMSQYLASIYVGQYVVPSLQNALYFKQCRVNSSWWKNKTKYLTRVGNHCFYTNKM